MQMQQPARRKRTEKMKKKSFKKRKKGSSVGHAQGYICIQTEKSNFQAHAHPLFNILAWSCRYAISAVRCKRSITHLGTNKSDAEVPVLAGSGNGDLLGALDSLASGGLVAVDQRWDLFLDGREWKHCDETEVYKWVMREREECRKKSGEGVWGWEKWRRGRRRRGVRRNEEKIVSF